MTDDTEGGFVTSPESSSSFVLPTPTSMTTTIASPLTQSHPTRPITGREESLLISNLDDQLTTITSRFTQRFNEGGYTSLKRLSKDYHLVLQTLLTHTPPPQPFTTTQYLIRIIGDLNEQLPSLSVPSDPRGIFYILKKLDDAIVDNIRAGGMSQTEKVRLRNELERTFEEYEGNYKVEEAI